MGPLAEPYGVGCTAEIAHVEPLDDGRMNIVAVGKQRFQIVSLLRDQTYLRGAVEPFPLQALATAEAKAVGQLLLPRLENYLTLLSRAGNVDFDASTLPNDPESLAYLAATVLQIPNTQKQSLLSMTEATAMLKDMEQRYRRELPVLRLMLQEEVAVPMGPAPFSLN